MGEGTVWWPGALGSANVVALNEEQFLFDGMLTAWGDQQRSRGLKSSTITNAARIVRRFQAFCGSYPWQWSPGDVEDFTTHAMSGKTSLAKSTIRGYQLAVAHFCTYITDTRYPWVTQSLERFGAAPQQICSEWNTIAHLLDYEGDPRRRALTDDELQRFFDAADERVEQILQAKRKGATAALRDAQLLKTIYAFGLRRSEALNLDIQDLRSNPSAPGFGSYGAIYVRMGKGSRGSGPKRRTVLSLPEFDWAIEGLKQWAEQGRELMRFSEGTDVLWPTERNTRVSGRYVNDRFADIRDHAGLPSELTPHSLRHTYVTNLIEWGYSEKFVQDQVGHAYASTTAIYTSVGDDFKNRVLKDALSRIYGDQHAQ